MDGSFNFVPLKEDSLSHWNRLLNARSEDKNCEIVGIDGKGLSHKVMLAAASPFLKELLETVPPYIEGCVILPDIERKYINQFLESISLPGQNFAVSESLANLLQLSPMLIKVAKEEILETDYDITLPSLIEDDFPVFENNDHEEPLI